MYICPNCKRTTETEAKFCEECGTRLVEYVAPTEPPVVEAQPVVEVVQPQPEPPQYQYVNPQHQIQYATQPQPPVNQPPMGRVVVGMILSILGLEISSTGLLYLFGYMVEDPDSAIIFAIILSIFCFPPSLIGFIMSKKNVNAGSTSKMSSVGKVLGLIGIILSGVLLFLGLLSSM